jgi:hypothetical protein
MPQRQAVTEEARKALQDGMRLASMAVACFGSACRGLADMGTAERGRIDAALHRLEAIRMDLERRSAHVSQDALFIGLNVAEAGLSSVTDALGEMREAYIATQPRAEPPQGTYREEDDVDVSVPLGRHASDESQVPARDPS